MIREDVLDIFARHSVPVPPDCITPFYQRKPGEGLSQQGWAVQLPSHSQVSAALRISHDKVVRPPSVPNAHQPAMPASGTSSPAFQLSVVSAAQSCYLTRVSLATAPSTFDHSLLMLQGKPVAHDPGCAASLTSHAPAMQGSQKVAVQEYTWKDTQMKILQQALRSSGRFLLVNHLPAAATRRDMINMFRGFRLLEGDELGPCVSAHNIRSLCITCSSSEPVQS